MEAYKFINGIRTDTVNDLNYTRLIHDKLHVGLLSRNTESWGSCVMTGIEYPSDDVAELTGLENVDIGALVSDERYYVALFSSDYNTTYSIYTNEDDDYYVNLWEVKRVNNKWLMFSNQCIYIDSADGSVSSGDNYNDYRNSINVSDSNYVMNLYKITFDDDTLTNANITILTDASVASTVVVTGDDAIITIAADDWSSDLVVGDMFTIAGSVGCDSSQIVKDIDYDVTTGSATTITCEGKVGLVAETLSEVDETFTAFSITTTAELINTNDYITIRYKNSDLDFYDANKTVYLSASGMGYPIDDFQDLVLLENSKDSTTIKLVNVPDSTIAKLNSGELNLTGRMFDVVDSQTDVVILKGLTYEASITLDDTAFLKFVYPTQNGNKVILATIDIYENYYQIYPDYTVNLLTEIISDNTPPGIDVTQAMDNYLLESLFLLTDDITNGMNDLEFITELGAISDVNFVSLANERNRLYSGANGFILDNSVYMGSIYGVDGVNWGDIKEYNLNKLLLNWSLTVENSATAPTSPTENDLWYDTNDSTLKIFTETLTDAEVDSAITASTHILRIEDEDWSTNILAGDTIVLSGTTSNDGIYVVSTCTADSPDTIIVVDDAINDFVGDETLDAVDETLEVWKPIDNDVRQIAIFYINTDDSITDLIYLANINKISIIDDMNIQLII